MKGLPIAIICLVLIRVDASDTTRGSALVTARDSRSLDGKQRHPLPILHYTFDNQRGTAVPDESDHGNYATAHVHSGTTDGLMGRALQFDGKSDHITRKFDPKSGLHPTKTPFAIAVWFRTSDTTPSEQELVSTHFAGNGHDGYKLTVLSQDGGDNLGIRGQLSFMIGAGKHHRLISGKNCADGEWHHAVGVWDGKEARLYLDGKLQKSEETSGEIPYVHRAPFVIGHSNSNNGFRAEGKKYFFKGAIDDVRFYRRALRGSEIRSLYRRLGP